MGGTKYVASSGLAFTEEKDMNMLKKHAEKGWNVKRFTGMGYELEQGDAEEVVFSLDARILGENEREEYYEILESAGWTHVCSDQQLHLFKAAPGTKPIYTDKETKKEKLKSMRKPMFFIFYAGMAFFLTTFILSFVTDGWVSRVFFVVSLFSLCLPLPVLMTILATYYHSFKLK